MLHPEINEAKTSELINLFISPPITESSNTTEAVEAEAEYSTWIRQQ